jgi:hypothetical protein
MMCPIVGLLRELVIERSGMGIFQWRQFAQAARDVASARGRALAETPSIAT